jgi:Domain of unknown function (DUF305)
MQIAERDTTDVSVVKRPRLPVARLWPYRGKFDAAKCSGPFIKAPQEGNVSLRGAGIVLGLLTALAAGAQLRPAAAQFMQAMNASMERMDHQMASAPMNGHVDHDFAAMMIPHHQGAIDMAKAELLYGKDPVMRRLAQEILVDQQSEIDAMQLWLEKTALSNSKKEQ